eukprot:COSAG01_NODE_29106_length_645_cov_0.862637_1_plen_70_part_01
MLCEPEPEGLHHYTSNYIDWDSCQQSSQKKATNSVLKFAQRVHTACINARSYGFQLDSIENQRENVTMLL